MPNVYFELLLCDSMFCNVPLAIEAFKNTLSAFVDAAFISIFKLLLSIQLNDR